MRATTRGAVTVTPEDIREVAGPRGAMTMMITMMEGMMMAMRDMMKTTIMTIDNLCNVVFLYNNNITFIFSQAQNLL